MKLTYNILWIEDKPDTIIGKRNIIKRYLKDNKGFETEIVDIDTFEAFEEQVGYDGLKKYDLLLVDLDLGNTVDTKDGNAIITKIRNEKIYTEIIFYSSNYEVLQVKIQQNFIEGIFTSPRKEIDTKSKAIIDITLQKVQDVNNLRGLIMAEVAELDRLKKNIVKKFILKVPEHNQLKKYIKEDIFTQIKEDVDKYDYLIKDDNSYEQMEVDKLIDNLIYDSYKKSMTVYKIKRLEDNCREIPFVHNDYFRDVIKKRNVFAHEEENTRGDGTKFLNYPNNGGTLEFTEEHCVQIRKDIRKYKDLLKNIETKFNE